MWEIDEDLDGKVDWDEFTLMFERSIADTTGLEPFDFYNVVQFMMYDADQDGVITMDECITMLYQRYGHAKLETELQIIFAGHGKRTKLTGWQFALSIVCLSGGLVVWWSVGWLNVGWLVVGCWLLVVGKNITILGRLVRSFRLLLPHAYSRWMGVTERAI